MTDCPHNGELLIKDVALYVDGCPLCKLEEVTANFERYKKLYREECDKSDGLLTRLEKAHRIIEDEFLLLERTDTERFERMEAWLDSPVERQE